MERVNNVKKHTEHNLKLVSRSKLLLQQSQQKFEIEFLNKKVESEFKDFKQSKKYGGKINELIEDIFLNPWGLYGAGKPELLKGDLKGYWSRRFNQNDRLVYKVEKGKIIIRSCIGHYDT